MLNTLRNLTLSLVALAVFGAQPAPVPGSSGTDRMLAFETAKLAVEQGEERLGVQLLEELVGEALSEPERLLYLALVARANGAVVSNGASGTPAEFESLVDRAMQSLESRDDEGVESSTPSWVQPEILALASALRLERFKIEANDRLEAVLERHYQALGGLDLVTTLRSYAAVGTLSIGDRKLPFRLLRSQPGFYRLDLATPAGVRIDGADLQAAWRSDPAIEEGKPSYLADEKGAALRRGAYFFGPLVRYRATGERLLYKGIESAAGRDPHVIEVAGDGGARELIYLDGETYLEAKRTVFGATNEVAAEIVTDYREIDGYQLPARQTVRSSAGTLVYEFETYRLNPEIDLWLFDIESAYPVQSSSSQNDGLFSEPQ